MVRAGLGGRLELSSIAQPMLPACMGIRHPARSPVDWPAARAYLEPPLGQASASGTCERTTESTLYDDGKSGFMRLGKSAAVGAVHVPQNCP